MATRDLPLPDNCRVRLVDLPVSAGGMLSVDADGFLNIYLNARLTRAAQEKALQHELRHFYRDDLYSDEDIRTVERKAEAPELTAIDGTVPRALPRAFDPEGLERVDRGLYLPTGENLARAGAYIEHLRGLLLEACRIYDVLQTPPVLPSHRLSALAGALGAGDIAFVAWQNVEGYVADVLHFSREDLYGAIYFSREGAPESATAIMTVDDIRVIVDIRRRNGKLTVCGIERETGERRERIY